MANQTAQQFYEDKKKRSPFLTLANGETASGKILVIKNISKTGYAGEEVEVLRLVLEMNFPDIGVVKKNFDNGSSSFVQQVIAANVDVGDVIKITRNGEGPKTKYQLELVFKKGAQDTAATDENNEEPPIGDDN